MSKEEPVLIVTDERAADTGRVIAEEFLERDSGARVTLLHGNELPVPHILEADVIFIGCAHPHPPEFAALEKVLRHINLTLRRGGLFTSGPEPEETLDYLAGLVKDCGMRLPCPPLAAAALGDVRQWARRVAANKKIDI